MSVEIFAFSGKLGAGKDFLARALSLMLPASPTLFTAVADQIKVSVITEEGADPDKVYGEKDQKTRSLLQKRGTEEGRKSKGENVWIDYLLAWINAHQRRGLRRFFITDLRVPNEVERLREASNNVKYHLHLFRVESPCRTSAQMMRESRGNLETVSRIANHASEVALDDYIWPEHTVFLANDLGEEGANVLCAWASSYLPTEETLFLYSPAASQSVKRDVIISRLELLRVNNCRIVAVHPHNENQTPHETLLLLKEGYLPYIDKVVSIESLTCLLTKDNTIPL